MIRKYILFVFALLKFSSTLYGQHAVGVKMNAGLSNIYIENNNGQALTRNFYPQPTYQAGIYYAVDVSHKLKLGAELLFTKMNGKEIVRIPYTDDNNNPSGEFSVHTNWRHLSYAALPIYIGYAYKKCTLNIGVQSNLRVGGNATEEGSVYLKDDTLHWKNTFTNLSGIDKFDIGLRAGFMADIYRTLGMEANYYLGLNNNLPGGMSSNWKMKNRQCTLGIRYRFFAKHKKEKEKK